MHFTRARDLVVAGLLAAGVGYILFSTFYADLPRIPRYAGFTLLVLAVVEAVLGGSLRSRIRHRDGARPVQALTAARAVALAKASSLLGAIMFGVWLALLAYVLPRRLDLTAAASDTPGAVIGIGCSVLLIGAALYLEWCCRTPDDQENQPPGYRSGESA
ncbi:hypothetical protein BLA60_26120 [Actinophytocola xinjiangensis]|uniref:DUF3180 domain-containing protein n=1 Tax=Actinophytocola xinjiangensis TaxID=485602 RepID=A0A7Z0WI64_9PSEU|nr:DUF3180 domain-containing protein [Actinophytocola xinjiangensis]OLF07800.1 hypothetical protein BLA60_26120 [Actinophytocola xinjiangensis]